MTLVGLGLPMIPDNARPTVLTRSSTTTTPTRPPSSLVIRPHTYAIGKVPACFFELLKQIPHAVPVRCSDPTGIIRLSLHIPSESPVGTPVSGEGHDLGLDDDTPEQRLLTNRRLLESRIKSLRLEIGDLSIADNLEKLCDHYFHLDKNNPNKERSDEFNRKLDMLLNEKCGGERKSCHEKWDASTSHEIDPTRHEPGKLVTFDLNAQKHDDDTPPPLRHSSGFGLIFHGLLSKKETQNLLRIDGQYLIRHVLGEEAYILSFRCNGIIQNFRIFKDSEFYDLFYLEDRKASYVSLDEMVNDGLRTLFLNLRAGSYVDTLTELAQINKHDSMISWLTSSSMTSPNSPDSRTSIYIGSSRRPSVNPQPQSQGQGQDNDGLPPSSETLPQPLAVEESELFTHFFLLGTHSLGKRSPCDLESCPSRSRACLLRGAGNPSVGKEICVCRDCGLTLHEKCLEELDSSSKFATCMPDLYKMPAIFGVDLTTVVKATMVTMMTDGDDHNPASIPEPTPPFVVTKCVQEIERIGVTSEGIYRISGSQDAVLKMQKLLERDRMSADLAALTNNDIDSVCALLKLYLRLLPEPLISRDVFSKLMEDRQNNILTLTTMRQTMALLPPAHKVTLRYLLAHWVRVVAQEDVNKMSSHNLSRVLVPSIVADTMTLTMIDMGAYIFDMLLANCNAFDFWGQ